MRISGHIPAWFVTDACVKICRLACRSPATCPVVPGSARPCVLIGALVLVARARRRDRGHGVGRAWRSGRRSRRVRRARRRPIRSRASPRSPRWSVSANRLRPRRRTVATAPSPTSVGRSSPRTSRSRAPTSSAAPPTPPSVGTNWRAIAPVRSRRRCTATPGRRTRCHACSTPAVRRSTGTTRRSRTPPARCRCRSSSARCVTRRAAVKLAEEADREKVHFHELVDTLQAAIPARDREVDRTRERARPREVLVVALAVDRGRREHADHEPVDPQPERDGRRGSRAPIARPASPCRSSTSPRTTSTRARPPACGVTSRSRSRSSRPAASTSPTAVS